MRSRRSGDKRDAISLHVSAIVLSPSALPEITGEFGRWRQEPRPLVCAAFIGSTDALEFSSRLYRGARSGIVP